MPTRRYFFGRNSFISKRLLGRGSFDGRLSGLGVVGGGLGSFGAVVGGLGSVGVGGCGVGCNSDFLDDPTFDRYFLQIGASP